MIFENAVQTEYINFFEDTPRLRVSMGFFLYFYDNVYIKAIGIIIDKKNYRGVTSIIVKRL